MIIAVGIPLIYLYISSPALLSYKVASKTAVNLAIFMNLTTLLL